MMSVMDNPYRQTSLPLVRVWVNGQRIEVPQEVVGRHGIQDALGVPTGTPVYRERRGRPVGRAITGSGHVFHEGDRYVAMTWVVEGAA